VKEVEFKSWDSSFLLLTVITFLPKTPHEAVRDHFPYLASLRFARISFQQLRRSTTSRGITVLTETRTIDHNLHKQVIDRLKLTHALVTLLFLRFSVVRIFPKAAVQTKKATLEGTLSTHWENARKMRGNKSVVKRTTSNSPRHEGVTKRVHKTRANCLRIEEGHERLYHLQFPILLIL
jgi:hypothetical protein